MTIKIKTTLSDKEVIEIHDMILAKSIGLSGLSNSRPLVSALQRIDNHIIYDNVSDIYEIAALYAIAIACGHTFNDGNKRTAMVSMVTFLILNEIRLTASNKEIANIIVDVAEKKMDKKTLALWLRKNSDAKRYKDN